MAALRSASFLQSEAPGAMLADPLPRNNVLFCFVFPADRLLFRKVEHSSVTPIRVVESSSCPFRSIQQKESKTLCAPYLHGKETSYLLRLDPSLLHIPCTPFVEYKVTKSTRWVHMSLFENKEIINWVHILTVPVRNRDTTQRWMGSPVHTPNCSQGRRGFCGPCLPQSISSQAWRWTLGKENKE